MTFDRSLARLASLSDADLGLPWSFRGTAMRMRYALYHALEEEHRALVDAPPDPTEAARILTLADGAFGDLRGLLAGLDDGLLDRSPGGEAWPLRRILMHLIDTERSYRAQCAYAIARAANEPVRMPDDRRPVAEPAEPGGGVAAIVGAFAAERDHTVAALTATADAALGRPTVWGGADVDLRHRLHRFASHLAEHTIQCAKTIAALDAAGGDARAICRRIGSVRGAHARRSDPGRLRALDAALDAKAVAAERAIP